MEPQRSTRDTFRPNHDGSIRFVLFDLEGRVPDRKVTVGTELAAIILIHVGTIQEQDMKVDRAALGLGFIALLPARASFTL